MGNVAWNAKGAQVRKGEKASPIVFYKEITVANAAEADAGDCETEQRRLARGYWVFAAEQVDGYRPATALPPNPIARVAAAEAFFAATGAKVIVGGAQACYRPSTDSIHMRTRRVLSMAMAAPVFIDHRVDHDRRRCRAAQNGGDLRHAIHRSPQSKSFEATQNVFDGQTQRCLSRWHIVQTQRSGALASLLVSGLRRVSCPSSSAGAPYAAWRRLLPP